MVDYLAGADTLAGRWAELRRVSVEAFLAEWEKNGRAARPIRNARMLTEMRVTASGTILVRGVRT
jgi:hypothetical protein